jgi:uncharacterized integral membrane protein (TIGR00698 family)
MLSLVRTTLTRSMIESVQPIIPGVAISVMVAVAATNLEAPVGIAFTALYDRPVTLPGMVLALLIGIAFNRIARRPLFAAGMSFSVKKLLRVAVALLGVRIALAEIYELGLSTATIVMASMVVTIMSGIFVARLFGRTDAYGALAGCATAVCGASAALAASSVLPDYKGKNADTVFIVVAVNALSTIAMLVYPALCLLLGFDSRETGLLLGATIHDVAQVVGAGYAVSETVGNNAVIVKLFRVFLLLPVVITIGWHLGQRAGVTERINAPVPLFALAFLALVIANSLGLLSPILKSTTNEVSRWGLMIAIAALGLGTSINEIIRSGWRNIAVVVAVTAVILVTVTCGILVAG